MATDSPTADERTRNDVVKWLASGQVGMSSKTMALWLAFGEKTRERSHPYDPDDMDRCLKLLLMAPGLRPLLPRMAEVSKPWAKLIERWDEIEASQLEEIGIDWTRAKAAPKTYKLMKQVLGYAS
jgi:hypothetical protein